MNKGGAPKGNNNAGKNKVWSLAIERAVKKRFGKKETLDALEELALKLLENCEKGDLPALKELGDRLEGKPTQTIQGTGENGSFNITFTRDDSKVL